MLEVEISINRIPLKKVRAVCQGGCVYRCRVIPYSRQLGCYVDDLDSWVLEHEPSDGAEVLARKLLEAVIDGGK